MDKRRLWGYVGAVMLVVLVGGMSVRTVMAETSSSSNYQATDMLFGAGSTSENCSGQYCAKVSIGDIGTGGAASDNSTAKFGAITESEPLLEVIVDPGVSDLGVLTTEHTASKTMVVRVRNYLSNGYVLQIMGNPPKYATHTLNALSSPTASLPGSEQFGVNVVANTSPAIGANPVQVPSDQTSFGEAAANYATPNLFKYVSGDVVARSQSESGRTDYTISMILNIATSTPAGQYAGDFSAVVVPVY